MPVGGTLPAFFKGEEQCLVDAGAQGVGVVRHVGTLCQGDVGVTAGIDAILTHGGGAPRHEEVAGRTQRVEVAPGSCVVAQIAPLLDGGVASGADDGLGVGVLANRELRRAEVGEDGLPLRAQQDVVWLDIAVEDAFAMEVHEGTEQGVEQGEDVAFAPAGFLRGVALLGAPLLILVGEGAALEVVHGEVDGVILLKGAVHLDDMGVVELDE